MQKFRLYQWCQEATGQIRYGPDRKAVYAELLSHLEDHRDALMEQGMTAEEATAKALESMGNAMDIAPQLAAIHKPWLGYLYNLVRLAAIVTAVCAIFYFAVSSGSTLSMLIGSQNFDSLPANFGPLDYYCQPDVSDHSDGYLFQITEAGYCEEESEFYFELRILHWPWMRNTGVRQQFWAVDSLGNYYASKADSQYSDVPRITSSGYSSTSGISIYNMVVTGYDSNAEWIELHYNRDGRNIVLHIDLTGGAENE